MLEPLIVATVFLILGMRVQAGLTRSRRKAQLLGSGIEREAHLLVGGLETEREEKTRFEARLASAGFQIGSLARREGIQGVFENGLHLQLGDLCLQKIEPGTDGMLFAYALPEARCERCWSAGPYRLNQCVSPDPELVDPGPVCLACWHCEHTEADQLFVARNDLADLVESCQDNLEWIFGRLRARMLVREAHAQLPHLVADRAALRALHAKLTDLLGETEAELEYAQFITALPPATVTGDADPAET